MDEIKEVCTQISMLTAYSKLGVLSLVRFAICAITKLGFSMLGQFAFQLISGLDVPCWDKGSFTTG